MTSLIYKMFGMRRNADDVVEFLKRNKFDKLEIIPYFNILHLFRLGVPYGVYGYHVLVRSGDETIFNTFTGVGNGANASETQTAVETVKVAEKLGEKLLPHVTNIDVRKLLPNGVAIEKFYKKK